jgi:hypothetical protein
LSAMAKAKPVKRAKQKAPKRDYAQGALATVLKLTGSKTLAPDKVERVDFKKAR